MRIANQTLTLDDQSTVDLTAAYPQDSFQDPAAYNIAVSGSPRAGWPTLFALVRPVNNEKTRVKRSIELLTPVVTTVDGAVIVGTASRIKLEVTPAPGATEEDIEKQIATVLSFLKGDQGSSVLAGERLI